MLSQAVESKVLSTTTKIQEEGRRAADLLHVDSDFEVADRKIKGCPRSRFKNMRMSCRSFFQGWWESISEVSLRRWIRSLRVKSSKTLIPKLELKLQAIDVDPQTLAKMKGYADDARKLGQFLFEQSFNPQHAASWFKFRQYSGTPTHNAVKFIGHYLWEVL